MIPADRATLEQRFQAANDAYAGTMRTFAFSFISQLPGQTVEDLVQELRMKLWACVQQYDPDAGAKFKTYFQGVAKRHLISMVRTSNTMSRGKGVITSLDSEAFALAVEAFGPREGSAEDWALALAEHGEELLHELRAAEGAA